MPQLTIHPGADPHVAILLLSFEVRVDDLVQRKSAERVRGLESGRPHGGKQGRLVLFIYQCSSSSAAPGRDDFDADLGREVVLLPPRSAGTYRDQAVLSIGQQPLTEPPNVTLDIVQRGSQIDRVDEDPNAGADDVKRLG